MDLMKGERVMQKPEDGYKCCFTGYRPSKFPFKLSVNNEEYIEFENNLVEGILDLIKEGCKVFYSGMAMGFDIIAAETVLLLKKANVIEDIKLISVLPFENQGEGFGEFWQNKFNYVLENCDEKIVLSDDYYKGCYQVRNKYMVDNSDFVLTWFDGKLGGTKNTIDYAVKIHRKVLNVNKEKCDNYAIQTTFEIL